MLRAAWVFDCDAPADEFQQRMARALEAAGWALGPAVAHDFSARGAGARCYVKLLHHAWGMEVQVKVKPGWLQSPEPAQRALWQAAREAQLGCLGLRRPAPPGQR